MCGGGETRRERHDRRGSKMVREQREHEQRPPRKPGPFETGHWMRRHWDDLRSRVRWVVT